MRTTTITATPAASKLARPGPTSADSLRVAASPRYAGSPTSHASPRARGCVISTRPDRRARSHYDGWRGDDAARRTHGLRSRRTPSASCTQSPADDQASELSLQSVVRDVLVEPKVGNQLLQLPILVLKLLELAHLGDAHPRELAHSAVEGRLADAELAAHLLHRRAALGLPQSKRDLLARRSALLHRSSFQREAELPRLLSHCGLLRKRVYAHTRGRWPSPAWECAGRYACSCGAGGLPRKCRCQAARSLLSAA